MADKIDIPEAARKWAESQGLELDDPRVQRYIHTTGGQRSEAPIGFVERDIADVSDTNVDFQAGRSYAVSNHSHAWDDDDVRFQEAVRKYAESQGVDIHSERAQKYARGLRHRR